MVVQKQDQRSGKLTEGIVRDVLTKSATHPHGIKVRLESGIVGRVKKRTRRKINDGKVWTVFNEKRKAILRPVG